VKWNYIRNIVALALLLNSCVFQEARNEIAVSNAKWNKILSQKKIVVLTESNSTDYFIYKGQTMGFQFDLIKKFASELNLEVEFVLMDDLNESLKLLASGEVDIIALNLTEIDSRKDLIKFTNPLFQTRQVLVQHIIQKDSTKSNSKILLPIRTIDQLKDCQIYVPSNSVYAHCLKNISSSQKIPIQVIESEEYSEEALIELVSNGDIDFTVCDQNIANFNSYYFTDLDFKTPISPLQNVSWAISLGEDSLLRTINNFLKKVKQTNWYTATYNKYYGKNNSISSNISEFHSGSGESISPFDKMIKEVSQTYHWDWRFISAIVYQESKFNEQAQGGYGAYGLMQMLPSTGNKFGLDSSASAFVQIKSGIEFLNWLDIQLKPQVPDSIERINFVLASYNIGYGHVIDAINLTKKFQKDTSVWDMNVAVFLSIKSQKKYYNDPVVRNGYCNGTRAISYVKQVQERYKAYKTLFPK